MANFAQLDSNNIVIQVIVINNNDTIEDGVEKEIIGINFCKNLLGQNTNWKQTSYNSNFRKHYAGIGYFYDSIKDAFIPPKPYPSWILNEQTCIWESPTPRPSDLSVMHFWNEELQIWESPPEVE